MTPSLAILKDTLPLFSEYLRHLKRVLSEIQTEDDLHPGLIKVSQGFELLFETCVQIRLILKPPVHHPMHLAEADLKSILEDMLEFLKAGQKKYVLELIQEHLLQNLEEWENIVIPKLADLSERSAPPTTL